MDKERVERKVKILDVNAPSMKYPQWGRSIEMKDMDGNSYEWNTMFYPSVDIKNGDVWIARMTIKEKIDSELSGKYFLVERVKFIKKYDI